MRQLRYAEFDFHVAAVRNDLGILHGFPCIGEQPLHFFFAFHVILAALIPHSVLISQLFGCLDAQEDIMGLFILPVRIMHIVGSHKRDIQLLAHGKKRRVHRTLGGNPMILKFQEIIILSKTGLVFQRRFFGFVNQAFLDIAGHLSCQTGGKGYDTLMVTVQDLHIHPGLIIIAFGEAFAHDFHQIGIAGVVFRQKDEMVIPIISAGQLFVKPGIGSHINLTAYDRLDPGLLGGPVEVDNPIHNAMVGDGRTVHPQLFYPLHIFLYLIRPVQKTVLRMDVKMCKCHEL